MSHSVKVALLALAVVSVSPAAFAQDAQATPRPAWPAYLFSIFVGFGTGQYWVGENGTLFLVGDLSSLAVVGVGAIVAASSPSASSGATAGYVAAGVGAIAFSLFRIWELIDVLGAVENARKAARVAEIAPVVDVRATSLEVGVQLRL